jgi:hypothetical protein
VVQVAVALVAHQAQVQLELKILAVVAVEAAAQTVLTVAQE